MIFKGSSFLYGGGWYSYNNYRVQFGCVTTVDLPIDDPDADSLHCRLATSSECGMACTTLPVYVLDGVCYQLIL